MRHQVYSRSESVLLYKPLNSASKNEKERLTKTPLVPFQHALWWLQLSRWLVIWQRGRGLGDRMHFILIYHNDSPLPLSQGLLHLPNWIFFCYFRVWSFVILGSFLDLLGHHTFSKPICAMYEFFFTSIPSTYLMLLILSQKQAGKGKKIQEQRYKFNEVTSPILMPKSIHSGQQFGWGRLWPRPACMLRGWSWLHPSQARFVCKSQRWSGSSKLLWDIPQASWYSAIPGSETWCPCRFEIAFRMAHTVGTWVAWKAHWFENGRVLT